MNTIKQHTYLFLLALASLSSLPGCSADDLPGSSPEGANSAPASSFQIHVTDGGYASADAKPGTRAEEDGYKTVFTAGDRIGVFAVKGNKVVNEVNNLCLTASNDNGSIVWKDSNNNPLAHVLGDNVVYYAYYPYREPLTGDLASGATDAAGFFTNVISSWSIATDQGTYANYTAQDLMIAQGTLSGKELSFSMQHQMALVVIELPKTKYIFNNNPKIPDYTIDVFNATFRSKLCNMSDGTYRYLVKPNATSSDKISGEYTTNNGVTKSWEFSPSVKAGKYKVFRVDEGIKEIHHTLQVGDFYMKDGSLLAGSTNPLTKEQLDACIGIVFWVGSKAFDEDPLLKKDHPDCSHGLVVALQDASSSTMNWSKNYESVQNSTENIYKSDFNIQEINKMCGYSNTLALKAYNTKKGAGNELRVLPCDAIEQYSKDNPAPANSSDWYFPSVIELQYVCWGQGKSGGTAGRINLNTQIVVSNGSPFDSDGYWSSTEGRLDSFYAWYVYFGDGSARNYNKGIGVFLVRPLLAF